MLAPCCCKLVGAQPISFRVNARQWHQVAAINIHSRRLDHLRRAFLFFTAVTSACFYPTSMTRHWPRVTPVQSRFRAGMA
jgi:hypothetical protein